MLNYSFDKLSISAAESRIPCCHPRVQRILSLARDDERLSSNGLASDECSGTTCRLQYVKRLGINFLYLATSSSEIARLI